MFDNVILSAAAESLDDITIGDAAVTAIFGYTVVFAGLVCLMIVLYCTGAYFKSKNAKEEAAKKAAAEVKAAPAAAEVKAELPLAPGSAGHIKLFDVPDKEAAMIMAIVADKMHKPLHELHFISIKEVK